MTGAPHLNPLREGAAQAPALTLTDPVYLACSVPSDSPDDWRALEDLRSAKAAEKYGLDLATHIEPFQVGIKQQLFTAS